MGFNSMKLLAKQKIKINMCMTQHALCMQCTVWHLGCTTGLTLVGIRAYHLLYVELVEDDYSTKCSDEDKDNSAFCRLPTSVAAVYTVQGAMQSQSSTH